MREEGWAWVGAESEGVARLRQKAGLTALPLPHMLVFDAEFVRHAGNGLQVLRAYCP